MLTCNECGTLKTRLLVDAVAVVTDAAAASRKGARLKGGRMIAELKHMKPTGEKYLFCSHYTTPGKNKSK